MRTVLLMIGSAFCGALIFAAGVYGYFYYQFSRATSGEPVYFPPRSEKTVGSAPPIVEIERFHGSHGSWAGEFPASARTTVLTAGPGKLAGSVTSSGKPLAGLRLRLALNGAVMSEWATSAADGRYEITLPYGKYRLDGYELDTKVANALLAGKTDGPRMHHSSPTVTVTEGKPSKALDFAFVDPVRKKGPSGDIPPGQPVVASWEPYPGAASYRLQLTEQAHERDYSGQKHLFEWRARPVVSATSVNLAEHGVNFRKGYYYTLEIEALDAEKQRLSQSPRRVGEADFRIAE